MKKATPEWLKWLINKLIIAIFNLLVYIYSKLIRLTTHMATIINQLMKLWKPGMVFTSTFLRQQDINRYLVSFYVQSGWISSIGSGAYIRSSDEMDWYGNTWYQSYRIAITSRTNVIGKGIGLLLENPDFDHEEFKGNFFKSFRAVTF